jgi:hypothetical protein
MEDDYKNALPDEVVGGGESENPRELHTLNDDADPLTIPQAQAAGLTTDPTVVYGDTDADPNREDQEFAHQGSADELP